jgi:hypothetical protein
MRRRNYCDLLRLLRMTSIGFVRYAVTFVWRDS